jgi:hypothetical protein
VFLRAAPGVAPTGSPSCYKGIAASLPPVNGGTANEFAGCCKRLAAMLLPAVIGAASGGLGCCESSGDLLRRRFSVATMVDTDCYHGGRPLLPWWKATATTVDTKCYNRTTARVLYCEGRGGRPHRSWTPASRPVAKLTAHGHGAGTACARRAVVVRCFFFPLEHEEFRFPIVGVFCMPKVDTCRSLEPGDRSSDPPGDAQRYPK